MSIWVEQNHSKTFHELILSPYRALTRFISEFLSHLKFFSPNTEIMGPCTKRAPIKNGPGYIHASYELKLRNSKSNMPPRKMASAKLCVELNINKRSVDRDLDVYRNQLSKLVQAKELLKEYVEREKKKIQERVGTQKASEAVTKCIGDSQYARH